MRVWTVDEPAEMERLAQLGVAAIITNRPALARTVLDRVAQR
jgi:glycerophosphoryl diester phosphodiesterase